MELSPPSEHRATATPQGSSPPSHPPRCGVVDLGSNSVRLVVFEGLGRNPVPILNEKAVLGLGRGLQTTGQLNPTAIEAALTVLGRYYALARALHAEPLEVLATAAVRDASNGPEFAAGLHRVLPGVPIHVLTGEEEARLSAEGVLLGFPHADGILGDLGGGSLEVVDLQGGAAQRNASLPLGAIRLAERAGGDVAKARAIADADLKTVPWLADGKGRDLYLVGGAWRALARMHMMQTAYPLQIVHHYVLAREEARDLAGVVMGATRKQLEKLPGAPQKRLQDLPFAALAMRRLLRATGARRVVFSGNGLREGWYSRLLSPGVRAESPLLAAGRDLAQAFAREAALPPALIAWTAAIFPGEDSESRALREAACWVSDIGAHDHPEYRAEQAFWRVLRQHGVGLDHHARAFLALAVALRYEAEAGAPYLDTARLLLEAETLRQAESLGAALRLAYTLCGGTPDLLSATHIGIEQNRLVLTLEVGGGVFAGESVQRRLAALATALGLEPEVRLGAPV